MSVHITTHDTQQLAAESNEFDGCNWVKLELKTGDGDLTISAFFKGADAAAKAKIYADAIDDANRKIAALGAQEAEAA